MKYKIIIILVFATLSSSAQDNILNKYITEGLNNNLALQQKEFSLNKSIAALDEARGLYFPSLGINARYTRAGGGRSFDIPVGDLVNPIYQGLNSIIGQPLYPTNIPNESILFFREREHDTKVSLLQPIFKPEIYFNYKIKSGLKSLEEADKRVFTRELVKEIKTAYYNYLKSARVVELYSTVIRLLEENVRVSNILVTNDKVTVDAVYRAEAELSDVRQQEAEALNNKKMARSYFNFLLNKPLDSEIIEQEEQNGIELTIHGEESLYSNALNKREELFKLESAINIASSSINLFESGYYPGVVLALDYGYQGEDYRFTSKDDYWMASLVLQWNLFRGFQDKAKSQQAEWEKKMLESKRDELEKMIKLQVRETLFNLNLARESIKTAGDRLKSAEKSFEIIEKRYANGMASHIEFLDARNSFTSASINEILTRYEYFIRSAEVERAAASYNL